MSSVGISPAHAVYPPKVVGHEMLGYITDRNGIDYSRDIGRSISFGGQHYFIFGDTFCKNEQGQFVGIQSNTVATIGSRSDPCDASYPYVQPNSVVPPLIPHSAEEYQYENDHDGCRIAHWVFGGVAETVPSLGFMWYEKLMIITNEQGTTVEACGVGIAQITIDDATGVLQATRFPGMIFNVDEPRFGSTSLVVKDDYVYLWGRYGSDTLLARVPKDLVWLREYYTYWDGVDYSNDWKTAVPVLKGIQQGAIIKSTLFGPQKPWIFLGCTEWADSQVMVGASANLEGPWELTPVFKAYGLRYESWMYCIYPHQWAFDEADGEVLVTWSEHWPGNVIAARLRFEIESPKFWQRVPLANYSWAICQMLKPGRPDARAVAEHCGVELSMVGQWAHPGMSLPDGVLPLSLHVEGVDVDKVAEAVMLLGQMLRVKARAEAAANPPAKKEERRTGLRKAVSRFFRRRKSNATRPHSSVE